MQVTTSRHSQLRMENRERYLNLHWVMTMHIDHFAPLAWADHSTIRMMRQVHADINAVDEEQADKFTATSLHEEKVKHHIAEIYATHRKNQKERLEEHVLSAPLPSVSLQVDFCKSKTSGDQYFGKSSHPCVPMLSRLTFVCICPTLLSHHRSTDHLSKR